MKRFLLVTLMSSMLVGKVSHAWDWKVSIKGCYETMRNASVAALIGGATVGLLKLCVPSSFWPFNLLRHDELKKVALGAKIPAVLCLLCMPFVSNKSHELRSGRAIPGLVLCTAGIGYFIKNAYCSRVPQGIISNLNVPLIIWGPGESICRY